MIGSTSPAGHRDLVDVLETFARDRRSGILSIRDGAPVATFTLSSGRLVRLRRFPAMDSIGALLVRTGVLQTSDLHGPVGETIEQLVVRVGKRRGVDHLLVLADDAIADEMHEATLAVLARGRGLVSFRAEAETMPDRGTVADDALTLPSGIDIEELILEARARGLRFPLDDGRLDESGPRAPSVLVVDDDPAFIGVVAAALGRAQISSTLLHSTKQALSALPALGPADVVICDLAMPRSTGRGFLGGLELLRVARAQGAADRIFVSLEAPHVDAEGEIRRLGAAGVLRRPRSDDPEQVATFLRPVLARIAPPDEDGDAGFDLAGALRAELGDDDWQGPVVPDDGGDDTEQLGTLKTLLGELNTPAFEQEIPLLILRFASSFFARGALFRVDEAHEEFVGLGGFGVGGEDPGRLVRGIRIPREAPCVLADAVARRTSERAAWTDRVADEILGEKLGARPGDELFIAPLFSPRGLEGVLLADNAGTDRRFPNLALVEIFLQQAAAAMERAALARAVAALQPSPATAAAPSSTSAVSDPSDG
jgi:CheY-like chemotaxis protein